MTETEQAIKEYDILIKGYEDDLLSDRYSDIVKEEFKRQRDIFLIGREALKEKAEREKGCEYCVNLTESATTLSFKAKGNGVKVVVDCDFDMKYCPKCVRKLVRED